MKIKPLSLELSEYIKNRIELQKFYKDLFWLECEKYGIPEAWGGHPLSNVEIEAIHREFLIKYNLL